MNNIKLITTLSLGCIALLNSCASKKEVFEAPQYINVKPIQINEGGKSGGKENYEVDKFAQLKHHADNRIINVGNTYGTRDAIRIKSQVYAQVPQDTTIYPEIHNAGIYTPSTHETAFNMQPLHGVPQNGYYPDGNRAYTQDVHIVQGQNSEEQAGHEVENKIPKRQFVKIRTGSTEITGQARILGIKDKSQVEQAKLQVFTEEGENLRYVSNLGWIAIIEE